MTNLYSDPTIRETAPGVNWSPELCVGGQRELDQAKGSSPKAALSNQNHGAPTPGELAVLTLWFPAAAQTLLDVFASADYLDGFQISRKQV